MKIYILVLPALLFLGGCAAQQSPTPSPEAIYYPGLALILRDVAEAIYYPGLALILRDVAEYADLPVG